MRVFAVLATILVVGCGPKLPPDTSPAAKMAVRGDQVVQALRASIPSLKAITCQPAVPQPCVPPAEMDKVASQIQNAMAAAGQLAKALGGVDAATDATARDAAMMKARTILQAIQGFITQATVGPSLEPGRQKVVAILSGVTNMLFLVSAF